MKKVYIAIMAVIALAALGASILYASSVARNYDQNRNNRIDRSEAVTGIQDYFDGQISRDEAVDLFLLHYANHPVATPTRSSVVTPTPRPATTPTPVAVSFPSAPTITETTNLQGGFLVAWSKVNGATSYQVAYKTRKEDTWSGHTTTSLKGVIERNHKGEYLKNGVVYTVYVRAHNGQRYGSWSKPATITPLYVSTPTPIPTATHVPAVERVCRHRLYIADGLYSQPPASHQEVSALNPQSDNIQWDLQFEFWIHGDSYYNGYIGRKAYFTIDHQGKWNLRFEGYSSHDHVDPSVYDHNVASGIVRLNGGQNARNTIKINPFVGGVMSLSVVVNGAAIPLGVDGQDIDKIRGSRYSKYVSFVFRGNAMLYGSDVRCN